MLIYSLIPTKPYAKHLLGFAYRKPLWAVLGFVIGLVAIILIAGNFGVHLPINGSAMITVSLPSSLSNGATVTALVSGSLEISFLAGNRSRRPMHRRTVFSRSLRQNPRRCSHIANQHLSSASRLSSHQITGFRAWFYGANLKISLQPIFTMEF